MPDRARKTLHLPAKPAAKPEDSEDARPPRANLTPINPLMEKLAK